MGLSRKFRIADDSNDGKISLPEFRKVISEHALGWSPTQEKAVFDFFDKDKSGDINYDEFLLGVRGQLNERRRQLVFLAFEVLLLFLLLIFFLSHPKLLSPFWIPSDLGC